jgi:hypothetical protein
MMEKFFRHGLRIGLKRGEGAFVTKAGERPIYIGLKDTPDRNIDLTVKNNGTILAIDSDPYNFKTSEYGDNVRVHCIENLFSEEDPGFIKKVNFHLDAPESYRILRSKLLLNKNVGVLSDLIGASRSGKPISADFAKRLEWIE